MGIARRRCTAAASDPVRELQRTFIRLRGCLLRIDESVPSRLRKDCRAMLPEFRGAALEVNSARVFAGAGSARC